jgi:DNA repair protein RecO (recombination protein O)
MTHKTKGIVLRTVKYSETSVVATIFTEKFGIQTYMVNGVRATQKKGSKAAMMQAGAILDMEVYHNELKGMQRIKECNWAVIYQEIFSDIIKNSIAVYVIELLTKTLKQPEANDELFYFCEDSFLFLDQSKIADAANFALFFSLQLPQFMGFKIQSPDPDMEAESEIYLDLREGIFVLDKPIHNFFIQGELVKHTIELLKVVHPDELNEVKLNKEIRKILLTAYQQYYALHLQDFGQMKTMKVLQEVMG